MFTLHNHFCVIGTFEKSNLKFVPITFQYQKIIQTLKFELLIHELEVSDNKDST